MGLSNKLVDRCKNFFALGMMYWMFSRPMDLSLNWIQEKFGKTPEIADANVRVLKAGYAFGETTEIFAARYEVKPASLRKGKYRSITGNEAAAWGMIAASVKSRLELFLGSYPITPASDILHELSRHKNFRVKTFQAEDEIAGITSAIGAAYGGALALTTTSGPGMALKSEAMGLAVMVELPLVIIDVQRGGPSTGLPTKTEQADLLQAVYGRNSEAPIPVIAPTTPADCFHTAFEASRIALKYMTPVIMLSDGYLANGAEPWMIPPVDSPPRHPAVVPDRPGGFPSLQQGRKDPRAPVGHPRHPGTRTPHRRPGETAYHGQRELRPGEPRVHGPDAAGEDRRHRQRSFLPRSWTVTRRATSSSWDGAGPTAPSARPSKRGARRGNRSPTST